MTRLGKTAEATWHVIYDAAIDAGDSPGVANTKAWDAVAIDVIKERDRIKWEETQEDARLLG